MPVEGHPALAVPPEEVILPKILFLENILLFGAGKSATVLIDYLLQEATTMDWQISIADANRQLIEEKTGGHPKSTSIELDINDASSRRALIKEASIVISMMPPALHILIAKDCIEFGKSLLTASYADDAILSLQDKVNEKGILFLCEMGLDPGIDHMSAMQIIDEIRNEGGTITSFKSHCGGLVAPESDDNPWNYKISWNPRNVVLAGKAGAIYKDHGRIVEEPYESLFAADRNVLLDNDEKMIFSFYPNRNSLPYIDVYGLQDAATFVRTTLRYPDFMYGWKNLVDLKFTDETPAYQTDGLSLQAFFKEHLQRHGFEQWLDQKLSERFSETKSLLDNLMQLMETEEKAKQQGEEVPDNFMMVDASGDLKNIELEEVKNNAASVMAAKMREANLTLKQLFFLGLDDADTKINKGFCSAADVLQFALEKKLVLKPGDKDMIVMLHEFEYMLGSKQHSIKSALVVKGDDHVHTAMAKTVGLPLGIAAKMILEGRIRMTGVHIPVTKNIYEPVLEELKHHGISFRETRN